MTRRQRINAARRAPVLRRDGSAGFAAAGDDEDDPGGDGESAQDGRQRDGPLVLGGDLNGPHLGHLVARGEGEAADGKGKHAGENEQCSDDGTWSHEGKSYNAAADPNSEHGPRYWIARNALTRPMP